MICGLRSAGYPDYIRYFVPAPHAFYKNYIKKTTVQLIFRCDFYTYKITRIFLQKTGSNQCAEFFENRLITRTPATISPMPIRPAASSFCPCTTHAITVTSTTPTPDQMA